MSIRFAPILFMIGTSVGAAPLCRDLRGLFTPCPATVTKPPQTGHAMPLPPQAAVPAAPAAGAAPSGRRPLVTHIRKLSRDSKGLYTPCPQQ